MLLSIIIPAYNAGRFIKSLLENLTGQIESGSAIKERCEIIVVNDGSADSTKKIVEEFQKQFSYIKLINQENQGESAARNTGIENASGEYLYFLDSDDSLRQGSISHFIEVIEKYPSIDLYCFAYSSSKNGILLKNYQNSRLDNCLFAQTDFLKAFLSKRLPIHVCSCVVRKGLVDDCLLRFSVGLRIGEDIEWLLNVGSVLNSAYFSNRRCYIYQIREDSIMQGYKTYSEAQYHSFEIRRDICMNEFYQQKDLKKYSNFWIQNQLLSNIVYYLKSDVNDSEITKKLVSDCHLFKMPVSSGNMKNLMPVLLAKLLPIKALLCLQKPENIRVGGG